MAERKDSGAIISRDAEAPALAERTLSGAISSDDEAPALEVKDTTRPGRPDVTRRRGLRLTARLGGALLLSNAWLNRGTAFDAATRAALGLDGLLPPTVESLALQAERVIEQLKPDNLTDLNRYNILKEIATQNQTLFYRVLIDNLAALAPIVYTPTVGEACRRWDAIYREPMGVFLSAVQHRGHFLKVLQNWPSKNVQIVVVTDGSRILGLGDLGANGQGIPVGKISLFVAAGGFHPEHSMPLLLDVGTDNKELLDDKFYMGERMGRLKGNTYWAAVEEMCDAVHALWPEALLQFEDFETSVAFELLKRRRDVQLCFNDDIQGTGAVVTAGLLNGLRAQGTAPGDARLLFYGAGSSAVGVARAFVAYLVTHEGVDPERAKKSIFLFDSKGLVREGRRGRGGQPLPPHKAEFALSEADAAAVFSPDEKEGENTPETIEAEEEREQRFANLRAVVAALKPHALVGLSAAGPSWPCEVIEELCRGVSTPLVFPLSNPTDRAEITAEQAYAWSGGRCLFASGSPFDPVTLENGRTLVPGQANNVFVFPGVGFGAVMAKATCVSAGMFAAAAAALAGVVGEADLREGRLYPAMGQLREVAAIVAAAVAEAAWSEGLSQLEAAPAEGWEGYIRGKMWVPGAEEREE